MANLSKLSLPLGYRFLPDDNELVMYYLKRKVAGRKFKLEGDIPDIALKNYSPLEIREMSYPKTKYPERFFFSSLDSRYSKGQRKSRSGKGGFWKPTGKDIPIPNKSHTVGWRRTRTFYLGKAPGTITDWHMHEYGLEGENEFDVLCKIFENKSRGPKTDEEYESPVEEDADDCVNGDDGSLLSDLPGVPSSSLGPEEGQYAVATISTLNFEDRQDDVLQPLPTHTATPIVPRHHLSSPGHEIHNFVLNNVSDEDRNTCNGSGSHQVDSVPNKSTVEDLDTHGIYKGSEDISDHREMDSIDNSNSIKQLEEENFWQYHSSPGSIDGFMELKDFFLNNVSDADGNTCNRSGSHQNEFVVQCKIFEKKSRGPKTDEEYESPVEDDADDCVNGDDENGSLVSLLPAIPSSSLGPEEGQSTVATTSTLDFENRQDVVLPPLPTHTATPIVPRHHHPSCPGHDIPKFLLNNVSDENGNTCNGSGSHQVDSVPTKSTVEDLDTHGIYKGSEDISDHKEMDFIHNSNLIKQLEEETFWQHHLSPGSIDGLEVNDLLNPMEEDCEAYIQWDDLLSPVAADVSNQGTSLLPAPNATPVLPARETVRTPKCAGIKRKSSKSPTKKPRLSINAPLMIEDSLIKASASHILDEEQTYEVDASNFDVAFGDVDDIPIEDLISISPGPQGYNTPPKVTSQAIIVAHSPATIDSLIWRCKHIPKLRKIPDRFLNYHHPLPQTGYGLTEVENELLMDFYKYFTHRKKELDMIISCVDSKSLRDLLDEGTWMDSSIIYSWFDVLRERCKDAYLADPSICSLWEKGLKIGDDMAFGPKGERVMDAMECKTLVYVLHAHNHWSLLVGYVDENRWEYYNSLKGEIWGQKTCERFSLWLQQRFMDHGWLMPKMWTITTKTDIPFQENGNDCGLFACAFAEHCIYRCPIEFTQSDIPYYRQRIVIDIFKQNWIRNASKLNLPPLPVLPPDLQ